MNERVGCASRTHIYVYIYYIVHTIYTLLDLAPTKQKFWLRPWELIRLLGGCQGDPISKIRKSPIQNGDPNPHREFQYPSSIRKCLKIGGY